MLSLNKKAFLASGTVKGRNQPTFEVLESTRIKQSVGHGSRSTGLSLFPLSKDERLEIQRR